jgi:hypothetical protein
VGGPVLDDQVLVGHVADQDADDAQGKVELGGDLSDGQDVVAEGGDGALLDGQPRGLLPDRGGGDQRLDLQVVVGGSGASAVIAYGRTRGWSSLALGRHWSWRCLAWRVRAAMPGLLRASRWCGVLDGDADA